MSVEQAKAILGTALEADGNSLYSLGWYLCWEQGDDHAVLDGQFTAEQLEAIAWWMKNKQEQL